MIINANSGPKFGSYPELTQAQRDAMSSLMTDYINNKSTFIYRDDDVTRNSYTKKQTFVILDPKDDETVKMKLNCSSFVQMVTMGRDVKDFVNALTREDPSVITKKFDFGYYFKFPHKEVSGVTKSDGSYFGFKKAYEDSNIASYSYNTHYGKGTDDNPNTRLNQQLFRSYMDACDMAFELHSMGCEIPLSEANVGDIVFFAPPHAVDDVDSMFRHVAWRNITHVGMIYKKHDKGFTIMDCTNNVGESYVITTCSMQSTYNSDKTRYAYLIENVVCCARLPIAFGIPSNVPPAITAI